MTTFRVTDPDTGVTLKLEGDSPPTEAELVEIFSHYQPSPQDGHIGNAMASGVPFGDEIAAGSAALVGKVLPESLGGLPSGTSIGEAYSGIRQNINSNTEAFAERNPKTALAAQVGTGIAVGGAVAPRLVAAIPGSPIAKTVGAAGTEGAVFGAGDAEPGERLKGGLVGGTVGAATGGFLSGAGLKFANNRINRILRKNAPTREELKDAAQLLYKKSEQFGVSMTPKGFDRLMGSLTKGVKGYNPVNHKSVAAVLNNIGERRGPLTLEAIDQYRQMIRAAGKNGGDDEGRIASLIIANFDDFLDKASKSDFVTNSNEALSTLKQARGLWSRLAKEKVLNEAAEIATTRRSSLDMATRNEFGNVLRRIKKGQLKGYTKEEIELIESVASGSFSRNVGEKVGRFGLEGNNAFLPTLGGVAGGATLGPAGLGIPVVATGVGRISRGATLVNADLASAVVRAGKNGREIVKAYLKHSDSRNPQDLAQLLLDGDLSKVKLNQFPKRDWGLVRQAMNIATSAQVGGLGSSAFNE